MLTEVHFGKSPFTETLHETIVSELLPFLNTIDHGIASLRQAIQPLSRPTNAALTFLLNICLIEPLYR